MLDNESEGSQDQSGEGSQNEGEGQESVESLREQLAAERASKARILKESQEWKAKAKGTASSTEERERERLEREKDYDGLLKAERNKAKALANENSQLRKSTLSSNIRATISKLAPDAVDLDDLLNQPKFSHLLKGGIDEDNLTLDEDAAKAYVSEVFKAKPHLRKATTSPRVVTRTPGGRTFDTGEAGDLSKKSNADLVRLAMGSTLDS